MIPPSWLWIPLTIFAAAAQTVRNTAQRRLTDELGALGATLVRFLYGMPLLTLWLVGLLALPAFYAPTLTWEFAGWILIAALSRRQAPRYCSAPWPRAASPSAWSIPRAR